MANTLTSLIPTMYEALDVVSREIVGFIPAVARSSTVERAALDQSVLVPVTRATSLADNTPGVTAPDTGDQTVDNVSVTITKSKHAPIRWNGEQTKGMQNSGNYNTVLKDQFVQAYRALTNAVETDIATLYKKASRAYGTAGTAPFGTANELLDSANVIKILDHNGAPKSGRRLVANADTMANFRGKQAVLFKVNEAGTDQLLREGIVGRLQGMDIGDSAGYPATHTKGTGSGYLVNNGAGYAIGDTAITLDTGTGTIVAGDVITFAGDTNKYVVATALAANVVTIAKPGLRKALADNVALTVGNDYSPNLAFTRDAIVLATRMPALPDGGDMADDRMTVTDPVSGLSFEVSIYRQYRQIHIEVGLAWGWELIKPAHAALLLG
jgi:hypothetical protein